MTLGCSQVQVGTFFQHAHALPEPIARYEHRSRWKWESQGVPSAFGVEVSHDTVLVVRIPVEESDLSRSAFTKFLASQ